MPVNAILFDILPVLNVVLVTVFMTACVGLTARSYLHQRHERRISAGPEDLTIPVYFSGLGTYATRRLHLHPGAYKIEYQFPTDALVVIDLLRTENGKSTRVIRKGGFGSWVFQVDHDGHYVFQVDTETASTEWRFDVRLLGRQGN